ncbi:hypothetical protein PTI98_013645 [Pleurotus ostreatus]|nr:hypothetical protein PTI98_013645 [Pleurotus ostreatus]
MIGGPRYANRTDYQELYHALQPLHKDGTSEHVKFTHQLTSFTAHFNDISEQEGVLNEVFSPLLDARPLVFDITLEQWDEPRCMFAVVLHRLQSALPSARALP